MASQTIYKITLINWAKYNSHQKKGYKATLIDNNFCQDAKLRILPMTSRWLFLNLVLSCSDICRDTVELSSNTVRNMLECNRNIDRVLSELQELQLLTFEKIALLKNRIEKKENRIEGAEPDKLVAAQAPAILKVAEPLVPVNLIPGKKIELKQSLMTSWAETYPQEFLELEFKKARSWILSNPAKAPKSNFTKFLNGWFDRGWEQYRKTLKSNPTQLTPEMVAEILGAG